MKTKEIYNAPEMESILLVKEAVMLDYSGNYGSNGAAGGDLEEGNTYNL